MRALALALVALMLAIVTPSAAHAQDRDPAYAEFYQTLDPHGEWVVHPRYGETWVPYANQDRSWRPYSRGQWVYTEEHGWYWESEEEFGWVVYHYGRWLIDQRYGWMWVPGREWGPAWVAWREGEEAVGWAPLPPEAEFDGRGDSYTFDSLDHPRYANAWIFIAPAMMTMPFVYRYFFPPTRSSYYFGRSRFNTFYGYSGRRVYNRGIDRRFVERHTQRPVPVLQVRPMTNPRQFGGPSRGDGERRPVGVYRPQIAVPQPGREPGRDPGRRPDGSGSRGPFTGPGPGPGPGGPGSPLSTPRQPTGTGADRPGFGGPGGPAAVTPGSNQGLPPRAAFPPGTGGDEQFRPRGPMFGGRPSGDGAPGAAPGNTGFPRGDGPRTPQGQPSVGQPLPGQPPVARPLPEGRPFGAPPGGAAPVPQPRPSVQAPPPPQGPPPGAVNRPASPPPVVAPPVQRPPPPPPRQGQPPAGAPPPEGGGRGPR